MVLKRTSTSATCLSSLTRPALVCSSAVAGDTTRSTTERVGSDEAAPLSQVVREAM